MKFERIENKARAGWYRMPERETERYATPFTIGTLIKSKRFIVRCGYFWQPTDCPQKTQNEMALQTMCDRMDLDSIEDAKDVVLKMHRGWPRYHWPPLTFDLRHKYAPLYDLYYNARGKWVKEQECHHLPNDDTTPSSLRTFWYVDLEESRDVPILTRKMRMIGRAVPGTPPSSGPWGNDEGEGPYFEEQNRQLLYEIWNPQFSFATTGQKWYVHPLDANESS